MTVSSSQSGLDFEIFRNILTCGYANVLFRLKTISHNYITKYQDLKSFFSVVQIERIEYAELRRAWIRKLEINKYRIDQSKT